MDIFKCRYYRLNRKLLVTFGLWPYQRHSPNMFKHILVFILLVSMTAVQIAKLVTAERTTDLTAEILSDQVSTFTCVTKYMIHTINRRKVKRLLENMKNTWESATDIDDLKILHDVTEQGRRYNLYFMLCYSCGLPSVFFVYLLPSLLDYILPKVESYPKTLLVPAEYFIDQEKYFHLIFLHMSVVVSIGLTIVVAVDTLFNVFVYHACALFKVASHRLEQIFDTYQDEDGELNKIASNVQTRISLAVRWHKNATEFTEDIVATYGGFYMLSTVPTIATLSITLYCTAKYLEQDKILMLPILYAAVQMFHILCMVIPTQKLTNYSAEIPFKAYSGRWYAASSKKRTAILLIMQRGLKPSFIVVGKMIVSSLESYIAGVQTCLSYFMVLLSIA